MDGRLRSELTPEQIEASPGYKQSVGKAQNTVQKLLVQLGASRIGDDFVERKHGCVGPFHLPGSERVPASMPLFVGKAVTTVR